MNKLLQVIQKVGPGRLLALGLATVTAVAFFAVIAVRLTTPGMTLLYSELDINDSGQIVAKLETMGVDYELKSNGSVIYVPDTEVLRLRMAMAQDGLPTGGSLGYEIFDRSDTLGATSFVQNINHLRALEGELARTIRTIDKIEAARVHLVLPRRELFSRDNRPPSASIVLKTRGTKALDFGQVSAIQSLVAAAVPDLQADQVSIVDDSGNLLSQKADDERATGGGVQKARVAYEQKIKRAVESLVEQSVGIGAVRAEVSAEMNFDRVTTNSELYDPDSQVARSTQAIEEVSEASESEAEQAVTVGNNLPDAEQQQGGPSAVNRNSRTEETVNFEISKTIRTEVHESGTVQRLSVAVLIDGTYSTAEDGSRTYNPRSEDELEQIEALVKSSIGYNEERGDQLEVVNMRFARLEDDPDFAEEEFLLTKPELLRIGEIGVLAILGTLLIFMVLRPLITRSVSLTDAKSVLPSAGNLPQLASAAAGALTGGNSGEIQAVETGGDELVPHSGEEELSEADMIDIAQIEGKVKASSTRKLVELVERHPEEAVSIMRNWMYQDG